jgi:C4-dicarboxylate-specific signal transduction histidine kinase
MLAIDVSGMALLSALVEALPHPVYVQEIGTGAFLYGNGAFRDLFDITPPPVANGEFHDVVSDHWYVLHSHPLGWMEGRQAKLCVLTDVTEERRARELIAKHRDAAHRTARLIALGEFASAVAHELNQPLAAIATYNHSCMRMLQSGNPDPEQLLQAMHICRDQAKRAGRIIQRLRGLLRHPGPALAEQDLNELVGAVLELSEPGAREAGVSFEPLLSARPPLARADRLLIEQAALNLVRNAVEAVQELEPARRRVTVATRVEADGSVTLAVSDLGDGVPPDIAARLFEPFVTNKRGGLGLGLSICRSVVEAHGGSLRYEGKSCFRLTLPR